MNDARNVPTPCAPAVAPEARFPEAAGREASRKTARDNPGGWRRTRATPPGGSSPAIPAATALAVLLLLAASPARPERPPAAADPAVLCDAAAAQASRETGVPVEVLRAISLTETGRRRQGALRPWPWTVNMEGAGVWFDDEAEALDYVERHHARGARSFDVGCFQLNFRWHGQGFASIEEMFQPMANARYAARFLADLHGETGDWSRAAGAYHSRTPRYAERYRARFDRILAGLDGAPPPASTPSADIALAIAEPGAAAPAPARINSFPLLQASGAAGNLGSLVPLGATTGRRFIETDPAAAGESPDDAG